MISFGYPPMEMRATASLPEGPQWQYEPKWDGYRCLAFRHESDVALQSKALQPLGRYFPEIVEALRMLPVAEFVLDGELVVPLEGALSFDALQQRIHPAASRITLLSKQTPATFLVFDLLSRDGRDIVDLPLRQRREMLEAFAAQFDGVRLALSPATSDRSIARGWYSGETASLDGVVAKRLDLPYASGTRDGAVKIKRLRTADCVVGGFRFAKDSRTEVGSLLLGLFNEDGLLDQVGFCSAFPRIERSALLARCEPFIGGPGFTGRAPDTAQSRWNRGEDRDRSYVKLEHALVLEVAFDLVTGGRIRHGARPVRWRGDKVARQCTNDQLL